MKRKRARIDGWQEEYHKFLGDKIFNNYLRFIDQVVPQSSVFVAAVLFERHIRINKNQIEELLDELSICADDLINDTISVILNFATEKPEVANKSWPTLLKSQTFFNHICAYISGLEKR